MRRSIVEVLELTGGGSLLLLECGDQVLRPLGDDTTGRDVLCRQCVRRSVERKLEHNLGWRRQLGWAR